MTTRGYAFQDIANYIVTCYEFGSTKTKEVYYSCLTPRCGCKYTLDDLNWLVENGYLFHYVWLGKSNCSKQSWGAYHSTYHHIYGITKKGWAVAHKYLETREE